ncbi:MAG: DUF169 domain-containing protein [Desulfobacterales bacterium]
MESKITNAISLTYQPVALIWSDQKPAEAMQFQQGKWGCIMWLAASAAKGKAAACDRKTFGCFGGGVGMGFGDQYVNFPGGKDCFCHFLSCGNEQWEQGRQAAEKVKPFLRKESYDNFVSGERYIKTPERVDQFIENLPIIDIPAEYVIFKPLADIDPQQETPRVIIFFADPDQLSALVVLANYDRPDNQNVMMPYAAGCQTIGIYPYQEAKAERQRAVVGLTDLSARVSIRKLLEDHLMTFAVPLAMFEEMEQNVDASFLERHTWQTLLKAKQGD